jgi:hypothetical protein
LKNEQLAMTDAERVPRNITDYRGLGSGSPGHVSSTLIEANSVFVKKKE